MTPFRLIHIPMQGTPEPAITRLAVSHGSTTMCDITPAPATAAQRKMESEIDSYGVTPEFAGNRDSRASMMLGIKFCAALFSR
jgi:hypothetical protein